MENLPVISDEEFYSLRRELENVHAIFYQLWEMGKPIESDEIATAAVKFNSDGGCLEFLVNPYFWSHLNIYNKKFVLCHEMLHILLNHGIRMGGGKNSNLKNKAADVVVNESLVREFDFDRNLISGWEDYCWSDTLFQEDILKDKNYEYYFNKLVERKSNTSEGGKSERSEGKGGGQSRTGGEDLVDDHRWISERVSEEIVRKLKEEMTSGDMGSMRDFFKKTTEHGTGEGNWWDVFKPSEPEKKNKKWESVINKWARTQIKISDREQDQWIRINRRFVNISDNLILPTEMEMESLEEEENKIKVWFFQDTSGSCQGYWRRFFKAARSLPDDKFDVEMHCFDTKVYKTTLESGKVYGGGGTFFHIMETHILKEIKHDLKEYPKAVFVITDGAGTSVNPAFPDRWYIFLTPGGNTRCFPSECKFFNLKDFE